MTRCPYVGRDDWFVAAVERVGDAAGQACTPSGPVSQRWKPVARRTWAADPWWRLWSCSSARHARATRVGTADAFGFQRAIGAMRSNVVRALVEEEGLYLTEASRRM